MKTSFNLFTILVIWLRIDGLNGYLLCEVCSDSNDPNCQKVELKQCSSKQFYCTDAYFEPSSHVKSSKGRLIKQCNLFCPKFNNTLPDICNYCINTLKDKCNKNKTIDFYVKLNEERRRRLKEAKEELHAMKPGRWLQLPGIKTLEPLPRDREEQVASMIGAIRDREEQVASMIGAIATES